MSLNIEKLENVNYKESRIVARCPACAELGNDNTGNHLSIDEHERFSCVMYPGDAGTDHRRRVWAMVGIKKINSNSYSSQQHKVIKVKKVDRKTGNIIKSNVLGHLGRVFQTLTREKKNNIKERIYNKDFEKGVPSVPTTETEVSPTVEKLCKCGRQSIDYAFDETESGKVDWVFYCSTCSPYQQTIRRSDTDKSSCRRCSNLEGRYCFGETKSGKYEWGRFCLECYPHHF